jgi:exosortase E/protease (VPEID-CTERM system)
MSPNRPPPSRWLLHVLAGLAVLAVEAWWVSSTGVNSRVRAAGGTLFGENPVFRLFLFPFLITLLYAAFTRFRAAEAIGPRQALTISGHALCFGAFASLTLLLTKRGAASDSSGTLTLLWVILGSVTVLTAIVTTFPASIVSRSNGKAALAVLTVVALSLIAYPLAQRFWNYDSNITVNAATALLQHLGIHAWSEGKVIQTGRYSVHIAPECSGYEGICLFLVFAGTWLAWFRKEYRFPAALILLPIGALVSWSLNAVRIAGFVLIGDSGHGDVAAGGFHSRAGWIAFTLLALGFCTISPRIRGIGNLPRRSTWRAAESGSDPIVLYLAPFLAIQAISMISAGASGGFEWLYPLRVLAPAAVIWHYRKDYLAMPWQAKPSLLAAGAGCAACALWIISALRLPHDAGPWMHLDQVSVSWRVAWLFFRAIGGVMIAPLVEELAFRGFLMRRIQATDFVSVDPGRCGWSAIAISSLAFGLMHGSRFVEGTAAGAVYGYTYSKTGKLGDAFLAHALTNLLLMAVVAGTGDWRYW